MEQSWFEMRKERKRYLQSKVWVPLRASETPISEGEPGYAGYVEEFFGLGSVAVFNDRLDDAAGELDWMEIGQRSHSGAANDGEYRSALSFAPYGDELGEYLVLEQMPTRLVPKDWFLHPDITLTLGLVREGNVWVRPCENFEQIVRIDRSTDGTPSRIEIRLSHLRDYLKAREMTLCIASYRQRMAVSSDAVPFTWNDGRSEEETETDLFQGQLVPIHEGGAAIGSEVAVLEIGRTDVTTDDDVPVVPFTSEDPSDTWSQTRKYQYAGRRLMFVQGELWRNERIEPGDDCPIVRGDECGAAVQFIVDEAGSRAPSDSFVDQRRWIWFRPSVVGELQSLRGGQLIWYTRETGGITCSEDPPVHFGLNHEGLVTVYAKDIALLPEWVQRIWAGYNVAPDGGVSGELLASQMETRPANTHAPESLLAPSIEKLAEVCRNVHGMDVLRSHDDAEAILSRCHRFRATNEAGLLDLAKDIVRLTAERFDEKAMQSVVPPPKGQQWGSLKSLENLTAKHTNQSAARKLLGPLVGVYKLRGASAHLSSNDIAEAFGLAKLDRSLPYVLQGRDLIDACVEGLIEISDAISSGNPRSQPDHEL